MSWLTVWTEKLYGCLFLRLREKSRRLQSGFRGQSALISGACLVLCLCAGCIAKEKEAPISEHTLLPVGPKVSLGEQYWGPLMLDHPQVIPPLKLDPPPGSLLERLRAQSPQRHQPDYLRPELVPLPYSQNQMAACSENMARYAATNGVLIYRANPVRVMFNEYPANLMSQKPRFGQGYLAFEVTLVNYTIYTIPVRATDFMLWGDNSTRESTSGLGAERYEVSVEAMKAMAVPASVKLYQIFLQPRRYCTGLIAFIVSDSIRRWRIDYIGAYSVLAVPEELMPYVFPPQQNQTPAPPSDGVEG